MAATGTAAVILLLAALGLGGKKKKKNGKGPGPETCAPFEYDSAMVIDRILAAIEGGQTDADTITITVVAQLFPTYPDGRTVDWQNYSGLEESAQCVWDKVHEETQRELEDVTPQQPDYAGLIGQITNNETPTPGSFYRIRYSGRSMASYAQEAIRNALRAAGADPALAKNKDFWREYRDLMVCSPFNDSIYGSVMPHKPGDKFYYPTPHGRFITLYPRHADNQMRMMKGMAPRRSVNLQNPKVYTGKKLPFLWLPRLDLNALRQGALQGVAVVQAEDWPDGATGLNPPADIMRMGVEDVPGGVGWGCDGGMTFQPGG